MNNLEKIKIEINELDEMIFETLKKIREISSKVNSEMSFKDRSVKRQSLEDLISLRKYLNHERAVLLRRYESGTKGERSNAVIF